MTKHNFQHFSIIRAFNEFLLNRVFQRADKSFQRILIDIKFSTDIMMTFLTNKNRTYKQTLDFHLIFLKDLCFLTNDNDLYFETPTGLLTIYILEIRLSMIYIGCDPTNYS